MRDKQDIKSLTLEELMAAVKSLELPSYRTRQIFSWLHQKGAEEFEEMSNLPKSLRQLLAEHFQIAWAKVEKKLASRLDDTVKYLYQLTDGEYVEAVVMHYHHGYSICISTQVGCRMGCHFCATGKSGFSRNLLQSEMLSQITAAQRDLNIRISNVVLMGMGEPLDNFDNVMRFLELVSCKDGVNIGARHISLSTCGLVDQIYRLMEYKPQLTLSVSLHAPNDKIRNTMMPVNKKWPVDTLLKACREYTKTTGRRVSFEYTLIHGVNDTPQCALQLAEKLSGMLCHVNLIPVNPVDGTQYHSGSGDTIRKFQSILLSKGLNATVRRTLGSDINASCGQLRRKADKGGHLIENG